MEMHDHDKEKPGDIRDRRSEKKNVYEPHGRNAGPLEIARVASKKGWGPTKEEKAGAVRWRGKSRM